MSTSTRAPLAVSIIIPAYNEAAHIARCLGALVPQLTPHDEIIVVDNNSTDATATIAAGYHQVRLVPEPRQGISYARTAGFNAARNPILARIDADTIAHPSWLATIRHQFGAAANLGALTGSIALAEFSPPGCFWGRWYFRCFRAWHQRRLGVVPMLYGSNLALRRQLWHAVAPQLSLGDRTISEDLDLTLAIHASGAVARHCPAMLVKTHLLAAIVNVPKQRHYYQNDSRTLAKYGRVARRRPPRL